jgi:hypothetical protein
MSEITNSMPGSKVQFRYYPKLVLPLRLLCSVGIITAGFVMQEIWDLFLLGLGLLFYGSMILTLKKISIDPSIGRVKVQWEEVSIEEWQNVKKKFKEAKRWKSHITNIKSPKGFALLICYSMIAFFTVVVSLEMNDLDTVALVCNISVLFLPLMLSGSIDGWQPKELSVKLSALRNVYKHFTKKHEELKVKPMLGLSSASSGGELGLVPIDARMVINFPDAPKGFYGVQVQCSTNEVSDKLLPYLYAVVLTSIEFWPPGKTAPAIDADKGKIKLEYSRTEEAVIFVVRQKTTRTSGYTTKRKKQIFVIETALEYARKLLDK